MNSLSGLEFPYFIMATDKLHRQEEPFHRYLMFNDGRIT